MILLLDIEKQKISLYGKEGMVEIPFVNVSQLYTYIDKKTVYYITGAQEVDAQEVVSLIRGMGINIQDDISIDSDVKYIHGLSEGTIYIDETLKFEGKFDLKLLDEEMQERISLNPLLGQLIKIKKLEIVGEIGRRKLMRGLKKEQNEKLKKEGKIEKQYSNMIIKESVAEGVGGIINDVEQVDILAGGSAVEGGSVNTMSELMEEIEGLE